MNANEFVSSYSPDAVRSGDGWSARCRAHDDGRASLSIRDGEKGVLLRCHAGCAFGAICAAFGVSPHDLFFHTEGNGSGCAPSGNGSGRGSPGNGARRPAGRGKIVASYPYHDENGGLLFEVVRFDPKDFRQRRPDDAGGWTWNIAGVRRVPYRLPELLSRTGETVYVVEGEKDVASLARIELLATTNPGGAGKWNKIDSGAALAALGGRSIVILPDADDAGLKHGLDVARRLAAIASEVRVVEMNSLPDHGTPCKDISDWLAAGGTRRELEEAAARAPTYDPSRRGVSHGPEAHGADGAYPDGKGKRRSQAAELVALVEGIVSDFYHDDTGNAYVDLDRGGLRETHDVATRGFKTLGARLYYQATGAAPHHQAVSDALSVISARCRFDGPLREVSLRVAEAEGAAYLDLGDDSWRAAEIRPGSWAIVDRPSVRFRRSRGMLALREPERGGSLDVLPDYINVRPDSPAWPLMISWLAFALRPRGPFPILSLHGLQGSAKSTTARMLKCLVDPARAGLRAEPGDLRDLAVAADGSWLVAFDNLSSLPRWLSDGLCRLATGGGFATRELWSDRDEALFDAIRPVVLTGIEEVAAAGDLLDRSLLVTLPEIDEDRRTEESVLWGSFDAARPGLLGALLDLAAGAMAALPEVRPERLLRMADYHRWGLAVEAAAGWLPGTFEAAYRENRSEAGRIAIEGCPVAGAVRGYLASRDGWSGTAEALLRELETVADDRTKRSRSWPGTPRALGGRLRRIAPALRTIGIEVTFERAAGGTRSRMVYLRGSGGEEVTP